MQSTLNKLFRTLSIAILFIASITIAQEAPIELISGESTAGAFGDGNVADVYAIEASANATLGLELSSTDVSTGILIVDASGNAIIEASTDADGTISVADVILSQDGTYIVTVFSTSGDEGEYEMTINLEEDEELAVEPVQPTDTPTSNQVVTEMPPLTDVLLSAGMEVRLQWADAVDLNLEVRDPNGNSLFFDNRTTATGGSFGFDANGLCEIISDAPVETATWPSNFLPIGSYEILVFYRQSCEDVAPTVPFTLTVTVNGQVLPVVEGAIAPSPNPNNDSVYIANFVVESDEAATVYEGGAYPDSAINNLPASVEQLRADATSIQRDLPIQGAIFEEQDFIVYSFDATADEAITISMTATTRNLDTLLQLIDPNGNLLTVNDDSSGSTNSTIANQRIVQDGTYLLVATRYGKELGGTEGEFSLVVIGAQALALDSNLVNLAVPDGDIQVFLTWNNNTDIQLLVRDPLGQAVYDDFPQITSGGVLAANGNVNCTVSEGDPLSYIYWPTGLIRPGTYEIEVRFESTCEDNSVTQYTLTTVVNEQVVQVERGTLSIADRLVTTFTIAPDNTATAGQAGLAFRGVTLDTIEGEQRLPITPNVPVQGAITIDNALDVYSFSGTAGQIVTITMQATAGSILDTKVFLLSSAGIQLADNDDAPPGSFTGVTDRTTDSLITGFVLPADGEYLIVASRFATIYGGTSGTYQLQLQFNQ